MRALLLPNMVGFPALSMERYARELFTHLQMAAGQDWEISQLICGGAEPVARLIPGKQGEKWASRAGRFIQYPWLASRAEADVYHVLDHSHANLALAVPGNKAVITCHDITPYLAAIGRIPLPVGKLTRYTFPQRVRAMQRCRLIITDSESTRNDLIEHFRLPPEQMVTVYLGINPQFTPLPPGGEPEKTRQSQAIRAKYNIPEESQIIFQLATPLRYKNTPTLLKAFATLRRALQNRDIWLLRAGGPWFSDEEDLIRNLGIGERVIHAGRLPTDEDLAAHYRAADVLAFPSLYEGFGWPPLEAMACGTPVVTSTAASLPEVVGDAGLTVPAMDSDALAEALQRVLTENALQEQLRQKAAIQAAKFTWGNCARDTLAVYKRVIEGTN